MQRILDSIACQLIEAGADVRRLFHGRGHCYEGLEDLVIDWLPPYAVIRLYKEADAQWLDELCEAMRQFKVIEGLVVQQRTRSAGASNRVVWGEVPEDAVVSELGVSYRIKPLSNQNSGLFLDMREGRRWVQENSKNLRMLNLFAYTCGFSVAALSGGADHVVNVDMSRGALETGRQNHQLNAYAKGAAAFLPYDLFRSWKRIRQSGPYDLIVIDPPSFQKGSFIAEKDYRRVIRRLPELAAKQCTVMACHNDPKMGTDFLKALMLEECPDFSFVERLKNPEDFPEAEPEKGLKVLLYSRHA
ncbi:MAG: class I SAM-dependent methyltransferase [Pontibacterium sp.]